MSCNSREVRVDAAVVLAILCRADTGCPELVPPDARVVDCRWDRDLRHLVLVLHSAAFAEVRTGEPIPKVADGA